MKLKALGLLLIVGFAPATDLMASKSTKAEGHTMGHYIVHAIGQGVIFSGSVLTIAASVMTAAGLCSYGIAKDNSVPVVVGAAAGTVGIGTGSYMFYKAPQWTDTYFLGYKSERTTKQNIVSLLSNIFIQPFPLGVWAGEFVTHLDDMD